MFEAVGSEQHWFKNWFNTDLKTDLKTDLTLTSKLTDHQWKQEPSDQLWSCLVLESGWVTSVDPVSLQLCSFSELNLRLKSTTTTSSSRCLRGGGSVDDSNSSQSELESAGLIQKLNLTLFFCYSSSSSSSSCPTFGFSSSPPQIWPPSLPQIRHLIHFMLILCCSEDQTADLNNESDLKNSLTTCRVYSVETAPLAGGSGELHIISSFTLFTQFDLKLNLLTEADLCFYSVKTKSKITSIIITNEK